MIIPVGKAQANFVHGGPNYPLGAECTLGLNLIGTDQDPNQVAEDLWNLWDATIVPLMSPGCQFQRVVVKFGPNSTGPTGEFIQAHDGGNTGAAGPPAVSLLVRKITDQGGRAGRGRMFVPGLIENGVVDGGVISSGTQTAFQDGFDDFQAGLDDIDLQPMLLHAAGSPIEGATLITSFSVTGQCATQRRRNRR